LGGVEMWQKYGIGRFPANSLAYMRILPQAAGAYWRKAVVPRKINEIRPAVIRPDLRNAGGFGGIIATLGACTIVLLPLDASAAPHAGRLVEVQPGAAILVTEAAASKTYCSLMLALHFPQTGCQSMVAAPAPEKETARTAAVESGVSSSVSASERAPGAVKEQRPSQMLLGIIPFMNNSSVLTSAVTATLDKLSVDLGKSGGGRLLIQGHANRTGGEDYSRELSRQRADAVAKYIAGKVRNIDPKNIIVEARGTASPLPAFDPADGNQRRVEIYRAR
jgi:outer membrane protein OmpA-like peptidoglycan-associated protein